METNKKNYTGFAVAVIILVSLVILLTGYIVYDKFFKDNENVDEISLVKNDINDLVKLLNTDNSSVDPNDACSYFGIDIFGDFENDYLADIAPLLMSCKYGMKYDIKDSVLYDLYTMDENKYKLFREYFNVEIEKTDNYYLAYGAGDGFAIRQYDFELKTDLDKLVASNGVYTIKFNVNSIHDKSLVGTATLMVSVKDKHLYYESFIFEENVDVDTLGRELFNKYSIYSSTGYSLYFVSATDLNYDNMADNIKLEIALLDPNGFYERWSNGYTDNLGYRYYRINLEELETSYKKYFGNKDIIYNLEYLSFYNLELGYIECKEKDNVNLICNDFDGGGTWAGESFVEYDYAKLNNNKLEVYVNFLSIDAPYNYKFCSDYNCNNLIDNTIYTEDLDVLNINEIFNKYKGKTGVYKMVFEKDTDENYYWVETDIVKK